MGKLGAQFTDSTTSKYLKTTPQALCQAPRKTNHASLQGTSAPCDILFILWFVTSLSALPFIGATNIYTESMDGAVTTALHICIRVQRRSPGLKEKAEVPTD